MAVANGAYTRTNGFGNDQHKIVPKFFLHEQQDDLASARQGRPIFRSEERVEIIMPGNPLTRPVQRVTDEHRERWPKEYEAFKKGEEMSRDGTAIEFWPVLNRAMIRELKALEIYTVEQIAELSDLAVQRIGMGGLKMRELARAYFDEAKASALTQTLAHQNEQLESKLAAQDLQIAEQNKLLSQMNDRLMALLNAPNPIQSAIPGMSDPAEAIRQARGAAEAEVSVPSALDAFDGPKRGRPRKAA